MIHNVQALKRTFIYLAAGMALWMTPIMSGAQTSNWSASLGFGTTGVDAGLQYRESPHFVSDASVGGFVVDPSLSAGGERYHLGLHLLSAKLVEDWYPLRNGNLFLSAGVLLNANRFDLQPTSTNGNYSFATPARFHYSRVDPYFGVGYGYPFSGSRWTFSVSAGAAYEGAAHVSVDIGTRQYAQMAYQSEKTSIDKAVGGYHWYPVLQTALIYRFQ